ncbi:hypothetical protein [Metabacillus indicus]|uniref:hypothetical protein n=1 Tax=Metabacillus indicus TaxID=246786 RepID=UPI00068E7E28|nr:hypothetical protein [Metabacillus indicus]
MIVQLLKKKRFLISFLFLSALLLLSIGNTLINDGEIQQIRYVKDSDGGVKHAPPYAPLEVFLLGSDRFGFDLLHMIVEGAKYTIGMTILIALLRMICSLIFSYFICSMKPFFFKLIKTLSEPFSVVPQTIFAFFLLHSVLWMPPEGFQSTMFERVAFHTAVLVLIAVPSLSMQLSGEIRMTLDESFIEASKTLGGRKSHLFMKHIIPVLYERWMLLFGQQLIQVLLLLAHLGVFKLFFGGTVVSYGMGGDPPRTFSYEWSGMIGDSLGYLYVQQWIALVPISFFAVTAICFSLMNDALKEVIFNGDPKRAPDTSAEVTPASKSGSGPFHIIQ